MTRARMIICAAMVSAVGLAGCASHTAAGRLPAKGDHAVLRHRGPAPTVGARVDKALGELTAGRVEAAEIEVRRALAGSPEHPGALVALARILKKGGDDAPALVVMRHVHAALKAEAEGRRGSEDVGRARAELAVVAEDLGAWLKGAATVAMQAGRGWEAELLLAERMELQGNRPDEGASAELAEALLRAGLTTPGCAAAKAGGTEARALTRAFCAVLDANPDAAKAEDFAAAAGGKAEAWLAIGRFLVAAGRAGAAHEAFEKAVAATSEWTAPLAGAGAVAALARGEEGVAVERMVRAIGATDGAGAKRRAFGEAMVALGEGKGAAAGAWQLGEKALRGEFGQAVGAVDATAMLVRVALAARDEARLGALLAGTVGAADVGAVAGFLHDVKAVGALQEWLRLAEQDGKKADAEALRVPTALALLKGGKTREAGAAAAGVGPGGGVGAEAVRRAGLLAGLGRAGEASAWTGAARNLVEATTPEQRLQLQTLGENVAERLALAEAVGRRGDREAALFLARAAFNAIGQRRATREELLEVHLFLLSLLAEDTAGPREGELAHHTEALRLLFNENPTAPGMLAVATRVERLLTEPRFVRAPPATVARANRVPATITDFDADPVLPALRLLIAASLLAETQHPRLGERLVAGPAGVADVIAELTRAPQIFPRRGPLHGQSFGAWLLADRVIKAGGDPCPIWLHLHPSTADSVERLLAVGAGPVCHPGATRAAVAELVHRAAKDPRVFGARLLEAANFALQRGFFEASLALVKAQVNPTASHRDTTLRALIRLGRRDEAVALVLEKADEQSSRRAPTSFDTIRVFAEEGALEVATELAMALLEKQQRFEHALSGEIFELARKREDRAGLTAFAESIVAPDAKADGAVLESLGRRLGDIGEADLAARLIDAARATRPRDLSLARVAFRLAIQRRDPESIERLFDELVEEPRATPANLLVSARDARQALVPGLATRLAERLAKRFPTASETALLQIQAALDEARIDDAVLRASALLAADNWSRARIAEVEPLFTDAARPAAWARVLAPALGEGRLRGDVALALSKAHLAAGQPEAANARLTGLVNEVDAALPLAADLFRAAGLHDAALVDPVRALQVGPDGDAFAFLSRTSTSIAATGRSNLFPQMLDALGVAQPDLTQDQRAELADHAAAAGLPELTETLRKTTATPEARARAMLAVARNCKYRDDTCALEAWKSHVESLLGAPPNLGRGDNALAAVLAQTLRRLMFETPTSRKLAPRLVAAFAHRFHDRTAPRALAALGALMNGASPRDAIPPETLPVLPAGGRLSLELISVYQDITALCLARNDGAAAVGIQRWLATVVIDRDIRLSGFKTAIRSGFTEVALAIADDLLAASPEANAGLLVEHAALEGMPGFAWSIAEATLLKRGPSPIAQRAMTVLATTLGPAAKAWPRATPGNTSDNRFEQRLFDIVAAFGAGNHDAVLRLSEPLFSATGIEARVAEMMVRSASVKNDSRSFGRFLDAVARRATPHAVALADILQAAERAGAHREALAVLDRLVAALPGHGPFVVRAMNHAIATGDKGTLDAWIGRARNGSLEPTTLSELATALAAAGEGAKAAALIPADTRDVFAFWRARVHTAAATGDWAAWRELAASSRTWDGLATSFTTNELLASATLAGTPEAFAEGLRVAADFHRRHPDRKPRAILEHTLALAVDANDLTTFVAAATARRAAWPNAALPGGVLASLMCRAAADSTWRTELDAAVATLAALPEPERIDALDAALIGTIEVHGGSCRFTANATHGRPLSPAVAELAAHIAEQLAPATMASSDVALSSTRLRILAFFGVDTAPAAREALFRLGPNAQTLIDLAEALTRTNPAEAVEIAQRLLARPFQGAHHHLTGVPDFPPIRARAFAVLGRVAETTDPATARIRFAQARAATPDNAIADRARNGLDHARLAADRRDEARGHLAACRNLVPTAPACRPPR